MFGNGIDVIVLLFNNTLCLLIITFFETIPFSLSSTITSLGG